MSDAASKSSGRNAAPGSARSDSPKSSGIDSALRGLKTVGFIGLNELARATLRGVTYIDNRVGLSSPGANAVYVASVPSEAVARRALRDDTKIGPPKPAVNIDIWENDNIQVASQSDLIILATPPDKVTAILSEKGIATILSGKVVVSMVAGVTIAQMYEALYPENRSPSPVEGSGQCFIFRARPNLAASIADSTTWVVPLKHQTPPPPKAKIELVEIFFSALGTMNEIPEPQIDVCAAICAVSSQFLVMLCEEIMSTATAAGMGPEDAERTALQSLKSLSGLVALPVRPFGTRSLMCESSLARIEGKLVVEQNGSRKSIAEAIKEVIYPLDWEE